MRTQPKQLLPGLFALVVLAMSATAAPFTQCPAGINGPGTNDPWPSCAYLLTINPDNSVTVSADTALLQMINNDIIDTEDVLFGVQNNSGRTQFSLFIQGPSDAEFFAFDPTKTVDFPYTGNGKVSFSGLTPSDDGGQVQCSGDLCPSSPFGVVNFTGGLAPGGSTWFGLEGASQVDGDPLAITASAVPEPGSLGLLGFSLAGLGFLYHRQRIGRLFSPRDR